MYAVPDVDEVVAVAKALGIHLGPEEAVLYRKHLMDQLREFDAFVQARLEEPKPPMVSPAREPGCRPRPEEDPLNAWTWKCRIEGAAEGALAGKTVSYKDHIAVAGMPMSFGSFALEGFIPDFDATVVTRVLQAGGTIIGKNVMNGLSGGFGTGGTIGDYGRPLNPHHHEHVTGGSSSGSAAAVAAGEVDISFGGDQGGSIRIPAAFCGIVGHKPTFGLVSHFGIKAYDAALADVDVLVMPTCVMTAPKNHRPGSYLEAVEDNLMALSRGASRNTQPFNYTGHPALALPVGKSSAGLPVSMQLDGRFFDDPLLMRVAYAYQHATDWDRIIGVHA